MNPGTVPRLHSTSGRRYAFLIMSRNSLRLATLNRGEKKSVAFSYYQCYNTQVEFLDQGGKYTSSFNEREESSPSLESPSK